MKELAGEVPNRVTVLPRKYPATFTHGVPGVAIGGAIIAGLLLNHIVGSVWNALPDLVSLGIMCFGIGWLFSLVRGVSLGLIKDKDSAGAGMFFSVVLSVVGFIAFFTAWCAGHPGPVPTPYETDCKNHEGLHDRASRDNDNQAPFIITCNDGYTYQFNRQ